MLRRMGWVRGHCVMRGACKALRILYINVAVVAEEWNRPELINSYFAQYIEFVQPQEADLSRSLFHNLARHSSEQLPLPIRFPTPQHPSTCSSTAPSNSTLSSASSVEPRQPRRQQRTKRSRVCLARWSDRMVQHRQQSWGHETGSCPAMRTSEEKATSRTRGGHRGVQRAGRLEELVGRRRKQRAGIFVSLVSWSDGSVGSVVS